MYINDEPISNICSAEVTIRWKDRHAHLDAWRIIPFTPDVWRGIFQRTGHYSGSGDREDKQRSEPWQKGRGSPSIRIGIADRDFLVSTQALNDPTRPPPVLVSWKGMGPNSLK